MEEAGFDFAFVFTTMSIPALHILDAIGGGVKVREGFCES